MNILRSSIAFILILISGCSDPEVVVDLVKSSDDEIYIPVDLEDAFRTLDASIDELTIKRLRSGEIHPDEMHFGLGAHLRNSWRLWSGSRLSLYFNKLGIFHPDDMSGIILRSYAAHLREEPIQLEEQIQFYVQYWNAVKPPEDFVNPETKHVISRVQGETYSVTLGDGRTVHRGRDQVTDELWYYEYDRGWYRPTESDLQQVEQVAAGNPPG